jgi:hypothetical protein
MTDYYVERPDNKYVPTDETDAKLFLGSMIAHGLKNLGFQCSYDNDHKDGEVIVELPGGFSLVISTNDFRQNENF